MHTIICPITIQMSPKKKFSLNLNVYRNAHHRDLHVSKVKFTELMEPLVRNLPVMEEVVLIYTVFPASKRRLDISNVCSIVDKYFSDALVHWGKLPDDNHMNVREVAYRYGSVDASNPRVEVSIFDLSQTGNPIKSLPT